MDKEQQDYQEYADLKSMLTSNLIEFMRLCNRQDRCPEDEIEDCIWDARMEIKHD